MPKRDGDREVPRRDTADDAAGLPAHVGVLRRNLGGYYVALRVAGVAGGPLDHVPRLGHVGFPLGNLLATLLGDDFAQLLVAVFQLLVDVPEVLRTLWVAERLPLLLCGVGGRDRAVDVALCAPLEAGERLARRRVPRLERLRPVAVVPLTADVVSIGVRHTRASVAPHETVHPTMGGSYKPVGANEWV